MARKKEEVEKVIVPSLYNEEKESNVKQDNNLDKDKRKINKNLPPISHVSPNIDEGLTDFEVEERLIRGLNNEVHD